MGVPFSSTWWPASGCGRPFACSVRRRHLVLQDMLPDLVGLAHGAGSPDSCLSTNRLNVVEECGLVGTLYVLFVPKAGLPDFRTVALVPKPSGGRRVARVAGVIAQQADAVPIDVCPVTPGTRRVVKPAATGVAFGRWRR